MAKLFEVVLVNGERRRVALPSHTGLVANALDRLDPWIKTTDGGWVQKSFVVEVRDLGEKADVPSGSDEEFTQLHEAAGKLADQAGA
jgi:hypothetical protein